MRVLVTRPQPEADALRQRLADRGHAPVVDPLLTVVLLDFDVSDPSRVAACIVTSRNALRAIERQPGLLEALRGRPLVVVGKATAAFARELGFVDVAEGPGSAATLAHVVAGRIAPGGGTVLSIAAEAKAFDLAGALRGIGYSVREVIAYRTVAATTLSPQTLSALASASLDAVILMSARTAATYARLIVLHNQQKNIRNIAHLCLSEAVAQQLSPLGPLIVRKAAYPNLEELLALADGPDKPSA